jgi:hypothetical protein
MDDKKDGGPAFPVSGPEWMEPSKGMSLRDYFAAKALPVAWAVFSDGYYECDAGSINLSVAECAYQMADAMLAAREGK